MKLKFLCAGHREWLTDSPGYAVDCWSNGQETAEILCEESKWEEALHYAGCAYEASEIILSSVYMDRHNAVRFFMSSTYLLTKILVKLNYLEEGEWVYRSAMQRLKRELHTDNNERAYINHQLASLERKLESISVFLGYAISDSAAELGQQNSVLH